MGFTTRATPAVFPGFSMEQKASRSIGVTLQCSTPCQGELLPSLNVVSPARLLLTLRALVPKGRLFRTNVNFKHSRLSWFFSVRSKQKTLTFWKQNPAVYRRK
jgi:hypothetical protein